MEKFTIKSRNPNKIGWEVSNESNKLCSISKNWVVSWSNGKYHMINVTYHFPACQQKPEMSPCISVRDVHLEWIVGRSSRGKWEPKKNTPSIWDCLGKYRLNVLTENVSSTKKRQIEHN